MVWGYAGLFVFVFQDILNASVPLKGLTALCQIDYFYLSIIGAPCFAIPAEDPLAPNLEYTQKFGAEFKSSNTC